jgi:hypothetical protein
MLEGCNTPQHPCTLNGCPHQLQGEPAALSSRQNARSNPRPPTRGAPADTGHWDEHVSYNFRRAAGAMLPELVKRL